MRTREELKQTIKNSKRVKAGAVIMFILSIATYLFFDSRQVEAEKQLMLLDHGALDETVLE